MEQDIDHVRLVKQAQAGDKQSLEHVAKLARESLQDDVYRMTLKHDLTQDIVQETVLEMLRILDKLKDPDRFWPWLYKIAVNKIRRHQKQQKYRRAVPISAVPHINDPNSSREAMSNLLAEELKEIVFQAMSKLRPQHRAVLTLRCYKEMPYPAIAEAMGCSEFAARKRFWRAKTALRSQLARHGFGKGSLPMALVLFGKMTASSEVAAAKISVTAAATKVGAAAALAAIAGTKAAIVSLIAVGVIGAGALVATSGQNETSRSAGKPQLWNSRHGIQLMPFEVTPTRRWYYWPEGSAGPVLMKAQCGDPKESQTCAFLQNAEASYIHNSRDNTVHIVNHRQYNRDGSVWRLPTDESPAYDDAVDLMMIHEQVGDATRTYRAQYPHALKDEYFQYGWPSATNLTDNRDAMHKRGWTYFTIDGRIGEDKVTGTGRIPFVYAASREYSAWLKLNIGDSLEIIDNGREAIVRRGGKVTARYPGGTFFKGLSRPWMGLHTIDTVRRDAAGQRLVFETKLEEAANKAELLLTAKHSRLVYTIDMEKDVVDKIAISTDEGREGELLFSYLENIDEAGHEFTQPRIGRDYPGIRQADPGMLWLVKAVTCDSWLVPLE